MQASFVVYRWKRGLIHETYMFIGQDVPLPARHALEQGTDRKLYESYVPAEALRIAAAARTPIRWVYRMIAPDDRADVACKKVLYELAGRRKLLPNDTMAVWRADGPVLFKFESESSAGTIQSNPFNVASIEGPTPTRIPQDHAWIGGAPINVALLEDMQSVPAAVRDVFIWPIVAKTPHQQDAWMAAFYRESTTGKQLYTDNDIKIIDCMWSGATSGSAAVSLERVFAKLHTSVATPLIQWQDDRHHILYKLDRKHKLSPAQLETLTKYERVPLTGPAFIATTIADMHSTSINSRLALIAPGITELHLRPNMVGLVAFRAYEKKRLSWAKEWLGTAIKTTGWALTNATVRVVFNVDKSVALPTLVEALSKYSTFVNVKRISTGAQGKFLLQWLRASNYKANVDIGNVINARLRLGVDTDTIVNDLVEINGMSMTEARSILDGVLLTLENPDNVNVREQRNVSVAVGLTMQLATNPKGIEITMHDAASQNDVVMAIFWLQGMMKVVLADLQRNANATSKRKTEAVAVAEPAAAQLEEDPFALSSSSSSGGSFNFIIDLQRADPQLFANNYSKRCQSASDSQPMVMTQAEFAALDDKYKNTLSSHMLYGSSQDISKHHVYFCPTIWCPSAKVPMSYQQYKDNGNTCPDGKEGLQILDTDKKRKLNHVGFYSKSIEGAEPCLPCCYSKPVKEDNKTKCIKKVTGKQVVEEKSASMPHPPPSVVPPPPGGKDYLLTHSAPLPKDRWGTLPRSLHMVLHPSTLLQTQCTQQLTAKPCLLRRGIVHNSDSFMEALGYLFTGQSHSKKTLLRLLREAITPEVFITLENGLVLAAFAIDDMGIIPTPAAAAKWGEWMRTAECKKYRKMFGLKALVDELRLSRELAIYKAFLRFHAYLASTESKDASLLVDAVRHLGVHLVLWERDAADFAKVRMRCPAAVPYSALPIDGKPTVGMLLQEKGVFEPIELGSKSALTGASSTLHDEHNTTSALKQLMKECDAGIVSGAPETRIWVETVRSIEAAVRIVFGPHGVDQYIWRYVVVSPDYTIIGLKNRSGFIECGRVPIGGLLDLIEALPHLQVQYQEDMPPLRPPEVRADSQDSQIYKSLLKSFGVEIGTAPSILSAPPVIAVRAADDLYRVATDLQKNAAAWRSTKWFVGRELLRRYDTRVAPFVGNAKAAAADFVAANIDAFPAATMFVEEALNEVSDLLGRKSEKAIESITEWMTAADRNAWPFLSAAVTKRGTHEWVFSQLAVERGLPAHVVKPIEGARPKETVIHNNEAGFDVSWPNRLTRTREPKVPAKSGDVAKLPWKWVEARKYSWRDWPIVLAPAAGSDAFIKSWMEWAAAERGIPFKWSMVSFAAKVYVANVVAEDVEVFVKDLGLLDDVRVAARLPKTTTAAKVVTALMAKTLDERREILHAAQLTASVTDLDFELAARWSGITIMIIANVDFIKADKDAPVLCADYKPTVDSEADLVVCSDGPPTTTHPRGSTKDLITNAALFFNDEISATREAVWKRPFVLLHKEVQGGAAGRPRYAPVGLGVWASLRHVPKDLQHVACCLWKHKAWRKANVV